MRSLLAALVLACLFASGATLAHHSFAAEFQGDKTATIEGVVTEVWFKNPHVRYYVDVEGDDGETITWDVRTSSPTLLVRRGWDESTIVAGDRITVEGYLGRDGRKLMSVIRIELPSGDILDQSY